MALKSTRPFVVTAYPLYAAQVVLSAAWISAHSKVVRFSAPVLRLDVMPDGSFGTLVIPGPRPQVLDTMTLSIVGIVLGVACVAHFVLWMKRVLHNAHQLRGKRPMKHGPNAWLWTFVPVANLVMPIVALYEAWTISDPQGDPERSEPLPPAPLEGRVPHRIGMAWAVFVVSAILLALGAAVSTNEHAAASFLAILGFGQRILAAILGAGVITMFARRQGEAGAKILGRPLRSPAPAQ